MAEDKKTTKPGAVPEYERRNFRRGIIVFFVALFILGSIAWGGWVLKGRLFQENRYFILRNIEITSRITLQRSDIIFALMQYGQVCDV